MKLRFTVKELRKPYEKFDKTFYPVVVNELTMSDGKNWVINSLQPIPEDTAVVEAELYVYNGVLKIGNVTPK